MTDRGVDGEDGEGCMRRSGEESEGRRREKEVGQVRGRRLRCGKRWPDRRPALNFASSEPPPRFVACAQRLGKVSYAQRADELRMVFHNQA